MPTGTGDILRVVVKYSRDGGDVQNVYHLRATVSSDPGDTTVVDEIATWIDTSYSNIHGNMPNDYLCETVAVWNETTDTFLGEAAWPVQTGGTQTDNSLPPQAAPLVLFNTNVNRSQGRKFLPGFSVGSLDLTGTLSASALTNIGNFIASILAGVTGTGWSGEPGNWNVTLNRFVPWVVGLAQDMFATQRRRYLGKGS